MRAQGAKSVSLRLDKRRDLGDTSDPAQPPQGPVHGEVSERLKELVSKTSSGFAYSWVRIPPSPLPTKPWSPPASTALSFAERVAPRRSASPREAAVLRTTSSDCGLRRQRRRSSNPTALHLHHRPTPIPDTGRGRLRRARLCRSRRGWRRDAPRSAAEAPGAEDDAQVERVREAVAVEIAPGLAPETEDRAEVDGVDPAVAVEVA
jgi:hypothetical protein